MPRAKRPLADADANTPGPKKATTGAANGKENATANYSSKTVAELSEVLKDRSLPRSGRKADLIQRLIDADGTKVTPSSSAGGEKTASSLGLQFVTTCRPSWDVVAEKQALDDRYRYDPDEDEETREKSTNAATDPHPTWKWIISKQGLKHGKHLMKEAWKRDQDAHGQYHYKHFIGYGFQEVMVNELAAVDKVLEAKDVPALWARVEAWATFIPNNCLEWFMSDDSNGILATLKMMGAAVISTLDLMQKRGLLEPDSAIPDIALVLVQLQNLAKSWPGGPEEAELAWANAAICKAKKQGVVFRDAPYGVVEAADIGGAADDSDSEIDECDAEIRYKEFNWTKEFANFKRGQSIDGKLGGDHYDLNKKSKASKKSTNRSKSGGGLAITLGPGEDINDFL